LPPIRIEQERNQVTIRNRVLQDSRRVSRIGTRLNCRLTEGANEFDAVVLNLSIGGAYLSSKHLPPTGSTVKIALQSPALKKDIILEGYVVRGTWAMSDHGKLGRFGIRFSYTSLDLVRVISSLEK